jgi:hypothetical protein
MHHLFKLFQLRLFWCIHHFDFQSPLVQSVRNNFYCHVFVKWKSAGQCFPNQPAKVTDCWTEIGFVGYRSIFCMFDIDNLELSSFFRLNFFLKYNHLKTHRPSFLHWSFSLGKSLFLLMFTFSHHFQHQKFLFLFD